MDRIEFIHSIDHKDKQPSKLYVKYIDQYMVLYDLVDRKDKVQYLSDNGTNSITFQILSSPNAISALSNKISTAVDVKPYEQVIHADLTAVSNIISNVTLTMI